MQENPANQVLRQLENLHYPPGPLYINMNKMKAVRCMDANELDAIYYLSESHCPSLRLKASYRYEKALAQGEGGPCTINKENINFTCSNTDVSPGVTRMLNWIREMPEEWTIVQLTTKFNHADMHKYHTGPLHVTVYNCGKKSTDPFCITVNPPIDKISGKTIDIRENFCTSLRDNKENLTATTKLVREQGKEFAGLAGYRERRSLFINNLKETITGLQNWLGGWRCLLFGKLVNNDMENMLSDKVDEIGSELNLENTLKFRYILKSLMKSSYFLSSSEMKSIIKDCFEDYKTITSKLLLLIKNKIDKGTLMLEKRHPVILIIDEKLDILPWHMMDLIKEQPVSRMPSLHFTYALFKEHEPRIQHGLITGLKSQKGSYIVNPGLDLKKMETRLRLFYDYWLPNWSGIAGKTPTEQEFLERLTESDLFAYSGHGNGTQYLPGELIEKVRVTGLVLLFGCSSSQLAFLGPRIEMFGAHQTYLIACCPCVVGMLWEVVDTDTDLLTTEFLSQCVPSTAAPDHWGLIDKSVWAQSSGIVKMKKPPHREEKYEQEVLRALVNARNCAKSFDTQAACIARGLPVKLD